MSSMTCFYTIYTNSIPISCIASLTTIKVMHWEWRVRRYFIQTLTITYCLFNSILVTINFITWKIYVIISLFSKIRISQSNLHLTMGCTPLAKQRPPKRLLNIWLLSKVAVALLVISTPAAKPSKILFRLNVGWLWVDIKTPAWAFLNISFSSKLPKNINK